jgi:hypothetical protein
MSSVSATNDKTRCRREAPPEVGANIRRHVTEDIGSVWEDMLVRVSGSAAACREGEAAGLGTSGQVWVE